MGRPRPQHCSTSNLSLFLQRLSRDYIAAPEDGRTPSESGFAPQCIFRQALSLHLAREVHALCVKITRESDAAECESLDFTHKAVLALAVLKHL